MDSFDTISQELENYRLWVWAPLSLLILRLMIKTKKQWGSASKLFFLGAVVFIVGWLVSFWPVDQVPTSLEWIPYTLVLLLFLRYQLKLTMGLPANRNGVLPHITWFLILILAAIVSLWSE